MAEVLCGEKLSEMIPFDLSSPIVYYPIRHHSPVCAWHLEHVIRRYEPDCILVEGPENANELLDVLTSPATTAPIALYYACRDEGKHLSDEEEPGTWRCYYPFLDTSPELVALRAARERGIEGRFIDLSYADILLATKEARGLRTVEEKLSYASDRYLAQNRFQERLCEKAGVRSFEEFWEKYFESAGLRMTDAEFVKLMNTYCLLSRRDTPEFQLQEDGCLAREAHMSRRIREAAKNHKRILVVAGGFHIAGLISPETEAPELKKHPKLHQSVYPMRYSMSACDALNGYASGMPMPGFYEELWQELHGDAPEQAWERVVLECIVRTGRKLRSKGETISAFDESCALAQARGLAALREKGAPGLYELQDAVLSSFVKGEASLSGLEPMRILRKLTTGNAIGSLAAGAAVPPLTKDFEAQCRRHRLKIEDSGKQEVILSVLAEPKHRDASRFLHRTEFLDCDFAARRRGPDLITGKDRNLIRETWEYRWSAAVDSALIEYAVSGGTVRDACVTELRSRLAKAARAEEGAELLLRGFLMGLGDSAGAATTRMDALLIADGDFSSLCRACGHLYRLYQWKEQYGEADSIDDRMLLNRAFDRCVQLLPAMHTVSDGAAGQVQEASMLLYQLTLQSDFADKRERLREALEMLVEQNPIHPSLHGAALGLLYGMEPGWKTEIDRIVRGYLQGTKGVMLKSADLLQGLFYTARDLLLTNDSFLKEIDGLLCQLEDADFTAMLPQLRLAFSYFLPRETDRLGKSAAALHGAAPRQMRSRAVDASDYSRNERIDAWAAGKLDLTEGGEADGDF
ncbi:MAG: hypothetical protein IKD27_04095 [Oscillospiraceae bacterium]|nr:hypothetical protein [Oscillospiraceae bacterium]